VSYKRSGKGTAVGSQKGRKEEDLSFSEDQDRQASALHHRFSRICPDHPSSKHIGRGAGLLSEKREEGGRKVTQNQGKDAKIGIKKRDEPGTHDSSFLGLPKRTYQLPNWIVCANGLVGGMSTYETELKNRGQKSSTARKDGRRSHQKGQRGNVVESIISPGGGGGTAGRDEQMD